MHCVQSTPCKIYDYLIVAACIKKDHIVHCFTLSEICLCQSRNKLLRCTVLTTESLSKTNCQTLTGLFHLLKIIDLDILESSKYNWAVLTKKHWLSLTKNICLMHTKLCNQAFFPVTDTLKLHDITYFMKFIFKSVFFFLRYLILNLTCY